MSHPQWPDSLHFAQDRCVNHHHSSTDSRTRSVQKLWKQNINYYHADVDKSQTKVKIKGIDKQLVGQIAAQIRGYKKPEPYKGKGVRYQGEHVRRKAGKTAGA